MTHKLERNRYQLALRPQKLAELMLQFMDTIDPTRYEIKLEDIKMIKVWRAEANFLRCFEDLFDLKFMQKQKLPEYVLRKKMAENIKFYDELLQEEIPG